MLNIVNEFWIWCYMPISEDDIKLCYKIVLGREADQGGLNHLHAFAKLHNITDPHAIAQLMFRSPEFIRRNPVASAPVRDIFRDTKKIDYSGVCFTLPTRDFTYSDLAATGEYEPYLTRHLFALLSPGMTFIDIGANLGLIALPAARLVGSTGRVIAFEASPRNAALLMSNAAANGISNISVIPIGASDRNGVAASRRHSHTSNQRLFQDAEFDETSELIPTVTLDSFLSPDTVVDVVKMDVEGFEYRVIQGAHRLFSARPHLYLEYSDTFQKAGSGVSGEDVLKLVFSFGYRVTVLHRDAPPELISRSDESDTIRRINEIWRETIKLGGSHLDLYFSSEEKSSSLLRRESQLVLRSPSFETFFRTLFAETSNPAAKTKDVARAGAQTSAAAITKIQQDYQPFYGLGGESERSARKDNLLLSVDLVRQHYADIEFKTKIRILDVGCNAGFVGLTLAETFPLTRGIDISGIHVELCQDLAVLAGSPARFSKCDTLEVMESGDADIENVDCVLLLNVVHQLIFARGFAYVQTFLARLAARVDVIFVELAQKEEYKRFQKDHLLPEDAASVLALIRDCNVQLVRNVGRPLYKITRNNAYFGRLTASACRVQYNDRSSASYENRKYYRGEGRFLKVFRFVDGKAAAHYHREVHALRTLSENPAVPRLMDWTINRSYGAILMEEISGIQLPHAFTKFATPSSLVALLRAYLGLAAELGKGGLYHNDLSPHNIYVLPAGGIRFIDFEQTDRWSYTDPFAVMLWTLYDVLSRDIVSYNTNVYTQLYVKGTSERTSQDVYPDFSAFALTETLAEFVESAKTHPSWCAFASEWRQRLNG
jgi:FkbM family methyltransferase